MVAKSGPGWRLGKSLIKLEAQVNSAYPKRLKVSDGSVGDLRHQATKSDHNPNPAGLVTAIDLTHDPINGFDAWKFAETLRIKKDPRVDYVISNGRIFSSNVSPWAWRKYNGSNNHAKHTHLSVLDAKADVETPWDFGQGQRLPDHVFAPAPVPTLPAGVTEEMRKRMMLIILGYEGRFDSNNRIQVHTVDGEDEIGGITQKNHPQVYSRLLLYLNSEDQGALKSAILNFYDDYTDPAQSWTDRAGLEFMLRDTILHRGPTGAAHILQMAVGVEVDEEIGPTTRGALARLDPNLAIDKIRAAREEYEDWKYGKEYREGRGQWQGLVNRWNKAQTQAKTFQKEQGNPIKAPVKDTASGAVAGGGTATVVYGITGSVVAGVVIGLIVLVIGIYVSKKLRERRALRTASKVNSV